MALNIFPLTGISSADEQRLTNLEDVIFKVPYYEEITETSGQVSIPQGGSILLDQWANGVDAVLSEIVGGQPNYEDTGLDCTLDNLGNYTVSGDLPSSPSALIYYLAIPLKFKSNLDINRIVEQVQLVANVTTETAPIQLKAISKTTQVITADADGMIPIPEVIQESRGIEVDANGHVTFNQEGFYRIQVQLNVSNTNNTNIDTWAEYFDGNSWVDLPDSGNVKDSGNSGIGNFSIETSLYITNPLTLRLKARVISGSASLVYDTADGGIGVPSCTYIAYKLNPKVEGILQQTNEVVGEFLIGSESAGNYASWNQKGEYKAYGEASQWEDVNINPVQVRSFGSSPSVITIPNTTIQVAAFSPTSIEEVSTGFEIPHAAKLNGTISWHLHWAPTSATAGTVRWGLEYAFFKDGTAPVVASTTIYAEDAASGVAWQKQSIGLGSVVGPDELGLNVAFRLFRDATHVNDTYPDNAAITTTFGAHIEIDSFGSNEMLVK